MSCNGKWAWSCHGEFEEGWHPGYDTKEDAINGAYADDPSMEYCYVSPISDIDVCGSANADYVLEDIESNCEISLDISDTEYADLQQRLDKAIEEWIEAHNIGSDWFRIEKPEKCYFEGNV